MKKLSQIIKEIRKANPNLQYDEIKKLARAEYKKQQENGQQTESKFRKGFIVGNDREGEEQKKVFKEHLSAVNKFLQRGTKSADFYNTTEDAVLVPENIESEIIKAMTEEDPIRKYATVKPLKTGNILKFRRKTKNVEVKERKEGDKFTQTDKGAFEFAEVKLHNLYAYPIVTAEMLEDSDYNLEDDLKNDIVTEFTEKEKTNHVSGDGIGRATGFLKEDYHSIKTETGGILTYDDIINLEYALSSSYRKNAKYFISSSVVKHLRKLKDKEGRYIWNDAVGGMLPKLNNYDVVFVDEMPQTIATGIKAIAFGDMKKAYLIVDKSIATAIQRDTITEPGFVKFPARKRSGGGAYDLNALVLLEIL